MHFFTALAILGLSRYEKANVDTVRKAWKIKIAKVHPDKNHGPNALILSQKINEAKDVLLDALKGENEDAEKKERDKRDEEMARQKEIFQKLVRERQRQAEEREILARERERKQMEAEERERAARERERVAAAKEAEEKAAAKEAEDIAKKKQQEDDMMKMKREEEEARELKRANFVKNRRPRAPGSRIHKKIEDYKEGRDLIEEFKAFFTSNVTEKEGSRVFSRDLFNAFIKSREDRGGVVTKLEMEMFWRHGKRLFMTLFPNCKYTAYKHQRCYLHVGFATPALEEILT
jgi:curved DNA-binding protein CbpA